MKPDIPCSNHPDSEGFFQCLYCGENFCERCCRRIETGGYLCNSPECVKADNEKVADLQNTCPHCGSKNSSTALFCGDCGKKILGVSGKDPRSLVTVAPEKRWDFRWPILFWLGLHCLYYLPLAAYCGINFWKGDLPDTSVVRFILRAWDLTCLCLIIYWAKGFLNFSWRESLGYLGFKAPNLRQLSAALILLIPILAGRYIFLQACLKEGALIQFTPNCAIRFTGYLFGAGFFEETFYRGFLFRFLRRGRSFLTAAILSSGLWALGHFDNTIPIYGPWHDTLRHTMYLVFEVFVEGIVAAYFFERGGNNIWGWMLFHVAYDSCFLIEVNGIEFSTSVLSKNPFSIGYWLSILLAVPIAFWLLPKRKKDEMVLKEKSPEVLRENEVSQKWGPALLSLVLVSIAVFGLFLATAQVKSELADQKFWQRFMEAHPRYADGYRLWAADLWDLNEKEEAAKRCHQALAIDPKNYKAWQIWGKALAWDRILGGAEMKFQKASECAPKNAANYLWWGWVLEQDKKKDEAIEKYRKVLILHPDETAFIEYASRRIDHLEKGK